jgi:hypothetical protein
VQLRHSVVVASCRSVIFIDLNLTTRFGDLDFMLSGAAAKHAKPYKNEIAVPNLSEVEC